jgi:hypothetical protein
MFRIEYKVIQEEFTGIETMSDEEIRDNFLLGNLILLSPNTRIEMEWEWIPLLDFAYCLKEIVSNLKNNDYSKEYFEFTENAETLEFSRQKEGLKIGASFSSVVIETTLISFEKAVYDFHFSISEYIRRNISNEPPIGLKKYLSFEVS